MSLLFFFLKTLILWNKVIELIYVFGCTKECKRMLTYIDLSCYLR